nr:NAD(P)-dependent oxidoreductase [Cellulosimicrobium sp. MM]
MLENAPDLVALGAFCIGTNQIDLRSAATQGVAVFNAPFQNTRSVVELALAEIIALTRRLTERDRALHEGRWDKSAEGAHEVRGRTLGIVGYGNIGTQLSVSPRTSACRSFLRHGGEARARQRAPHGHARRAARAGRRRHAPRRRAPGQRRALRRQAVRRMRPGSIFLNLSRGFVVDYGALREAIVEGRVAGAAVDVFPHEPKRKGDAFDSELRGLPNVILTPHIGGSTEEARRRSGSSCPPSCATTSPPAPRRSASTCRTSRSSRRRASRASRTCTATPPVSSPPSTRPCRARDEHRGPAPRHPRRDRLRRHRRRLARGARRHRGRWPRWSRRSPCAPRLTRPAPRTLRRAGPSARGEGPRRP